MKEIAVRSALGVSRAALLATGLALFAGPGGAAQPPLLWVAEQRVTDEPEESRMDWPGGTILADARVADCLHFIWRDDMFNSTFCPAGIQSCHAGVHKIGGVFDPSSPWGTAGTGTTCLVTRPQLEEANVYNDNAPNIAADGAGRLHAIWEEKNAIPLTIAYRMRESIEGFTGPCSSIQSSASDGDCSTSGWGPFTAGTRLSDSTETGLVGAANSTICLYRPATGTTGPEDEVLHIFYHGAEPKHRYRVLGNPNDWSMDDWMPIDSSEVIASSAQLSDATLTNGQVDRGTGVIYTTIWDPLPPPDPPPPPEVPKPGNIRFATSPGLDGAWSLESTVLNTALYPWVPGSISDLTITSNGDVFVVWFENLYNLDCEPTESCQEPLQQRCVLRQRHFASGPWGPAGTWGPYVYFASEDLGWDDLDPSEKSRACVVEARGLEVHVAWAQGNVNPTRIKHRYLTAGGDPSDPDHWSLPQTLNPDSDGGLPKLYLDDHERMYVVWRDNRFCCPNSEIYMRFVNLDPTGVTYQGPSLGQRGLELSVFGPNPFRTRTEARLLVPGALGAKGAFVTARVYDVRGARVRSLIDGQMVPGSYRVTWDGSDDRGGAATAGIYFLQVIANGKRSGTQRITLLR